MQSIARGFLLIAMLAAPDVAPAALASCPATGQPLTRVAPRLPSRLHNEFEIEAAIRLPVQRDGSVHSPVVTITKARPLGRSSGAPKGIVVAMLVAVRQWRYAPRAQACVAKVPMTFVN